MLSQPPPAPRPQQLCEGSFPPTPFHTCVSGPRMRVNGKNRIGG